MIGIFIVGVFLGAVIGMSIMALMQMARDSDTE